MKNMSKTKYIERIIDLLEKCKDESVLYFVMCFLEKHLSTVQVEGR